MLAATVVNFTVYTGKPEDVPADVPVARGAFADKLRTLLESRGISLPKNHQREVSFISGLHAAARQAGFWLVLALSVVGMLVLRHVVDGACHGRRPADDEQHAGARRWQHYSFVAANACFLRFARSFIPGAADDLRSRW